MGATTEFDWNRLEAMLAQLAQQSQETDRRMQETDRVLREVSRQLGRLGNRLGQFVQDMVEPAVVRLFRERGIPVHRVYPNAQARNDAGQVEMEIDLLVINGDHIVAVECKSRLISDDVDEHLRRLSRFKQCFTEHADKVLIGAVAAMGAPDEVVRYAERQGLYVLVQSDDDVVLRNSPQFEPKRW